MFIDDVQSEMETSTWEKEMVSYRLPYSCCNLRLILRPIPIQESKLAL